jgi:hypothetical protein
MGNRHFRLSVVAALGTLIVGPGSVLLAAQRATPDANKTAGKPFTQARTPDGQPDIQGVWNFSTPTPLERPSGGKEAFTDEEFGELLKQVAPLTAGAAADRDTRPARGSKLDVDLAYNEFWSERGRPLRRTSLIIDPADGKLPPLTAEAQRRAAARASTRERPAEGPEDRGLWERCISRGEIPRIPGTYNNNVQIFQVPGYVVLHYEMVHESRIIPLDGRPHLGPALRQWLGDSRGRWEGNTLTVETTNFSDKTNFRESGAGLHLVERFSRTDANRIDYQFTVTDPSTFTHPWTAGLPWNRLSGQVYEYACHEGNSGLRGILEGARADEKAAAAARTGSK